MADKHSLRRDLLLSNFDKNMTIEKAKFEPIPPLNIPEDTASTLVNNEDSSELEEHAHTPKILPPPPSSVDKRKEGENEDHSSTIRKKKSKSSMHGSIKATEVFHRTLSDAISNVDDSDENEHYLYPYSGNESYISDRDYSIRSPRDRGWKQWLRYKLSRKPSLIPEDESEHHRHKLRDHIVDHNDYYYYHPPTLSGMESIRSTRSKTYPIHKPSQPMNKKYRRHPAYNYYNRDMGGYTSDDEDAPLLVRRQQKRNRNQKKSCHPLFRHTILSILSIILLSIIILIYTSKPLTDVVVNIDRVLSTDKELIFDLKVIADNRNWWTIHVADADLSVFAFSHIVPHSLYSHENITQSINNTDTITVNTTVKKTDPAEYLGVVYHFDEPLSITSSAFNNRKKETVTQIRIKSPGADISGNERWSRMIRYPYGLVIRGVIKYRPVPIIMDLYYPQSVALCNVSQINPTTGVVTHDPDRSYCLYEDSKHVHIFSRYK
ncbi:hypothetical protein BDB01DRAFT_831390 [Pilobolus umbonatus]|nr:hypothetical protein BDB01DRAFT_831390 [Pilobolus umbonatus]